jgi:putative transposase
MTVKLEYGKYYHIYNRGNNYENIFIDKYDYEKFIYLLDIFISPVAEIISWCLLKNHFHICVKIKNDIEIGYLNKKFMKSTEYEKKWKTYFPEVPDEQFSKKPIPTEQFKHFVSS